VPVVAGAHGERVRRVRELLTPKGRREQGRYAFEGMTLLDEARRAQIPIDEVYVSEAAYAREPRLRDLDGRGTSVYLVDDRTMQKISDLQTPPGVVAVTRSRFHLCTEVLQGKLTLVLGGVGDPTNAGTLLRSAEAFGIGGVLFGRAGVDPYHPKVVRGAMGAHFRLAIGVTDADELALEARRENVQLVGLDAHGDDVRNAVVLAPAAIVVGNERHGLGTWGDACTLRVAIPMSGAAESLNVAVAGSIALYELSRAFKSIGMPETTR
jgi:RNA methyltransferase, TrmH family